MARLAALDQSKKIADKKTYKRELDTLQMTILQIQQAYFRQQRRSIIVLEGWDTAGKGGLIRRLGEHLDPRGFRVWPIGAPTPAEQGRHYLYRFWQKLPEPGSIVVFDRSWYGRVLVERVEGFAAPGEWRRAYDEINAFERLLTDDGVRMIKLFLHITPEEQLARFQARLETPHKRWKLTEEDLRNRARWTDYAAAIEEMVERTSTESAPWHVIPANFKWYARVEGLKRVAATLGDGIDLTPPPADPEIAAAIAAMALQEQNQ
jgi:AMP-polyphosphate phosphotransferase